MLLVWDESWDDPSSAWWAKANRAQDHIESLRRLINDFRNLEPYTLTPEPRDSRGWVPYRLGHHHAVPVEVSTTVGDILHNLRAALESLAFEVARRCQGGSLTPEQEPDPTFPICKSPDAFQKFFSGKRGALFDDRARMAFRDVQSFVILESARNLGVDLETTYEENAREDILHRLNTLWNIDKHRRLIPTAYWPDMISWGSNGPSNRIAHPGDGTLEGGSVLLYIEGADEGMGDILDHDYNLVLTDDPAFARDGTGATGDVVSLLQEWHDHITKSIVFPRIFAFMSQPPDDPTRSGPEVTQ